MLSWQKVSRCRWLSSGGHLIVKDTIIGYLLYPSVVEFEKQYGADYKSFENLKEAKHYATNTTTNKTAPGARAG